jgi:hypothetical protein
MTLNDKKYIVANVFAPESFWNLTSPRPGGCGAGKFGDLLVPDALWGLNVTFLCKIHDHMYSTGETELDREKADRVLRNNLMRWISHETNNGLLSWLRMRRAAKYYLAVRMFGGPAFWNSKHV